MLFAYFYGGRLKALMNTAAGSLRFIEASAALDAEKQTEEDRVKAAKLIERAAEVPAQMAEEFANVCKYVAILVQFGDEARACKVLRVLIEKMYASGKGCELRLDEAIEEAQLLALNCPDAMVQSQLDGGAGFHGNGAQAEKPPKGKADPRGKADQVLKHKKQCRFKDDCWKMAKGENCKYMHSKGELKAYKASGSAPYYKFRG